MVEFDVQVHGVELSGRMPVWLTVLLLLIFSVPLVVGWRIAGRRLRERSRSVLQRLRAWMRRVLMQILNDRDDQSSV